MFRNRFVMYWLFIELAYTIFDMSSSDEWEDIDSYMRTMTVLRGKMIAIISLVQIGHFDIVNVIPNWQ